MEKIKNIVAVPFSSEWSDMGDWETVWLKAKKDLSEVSMSSDANSIDCSNTLLRSESSSQKIVGLGLKNIIAVATPDAVLVADKSKAQDIKNLVDYLKAKKIPQAQTFPKDYRPWGWFEILTQGDCFQVKRIFVKLGAALSLQSHRFRSEHWIVVQGEATVQIGNEISTISSGESIYVPCGEKHRLSNRGKVEMVLIEVQIGTYLGEDDIVRYEDQYNRF